MKPRTTLILFVALIGIGLFYYLWGVKGEAQREARQERQNRILPMLETGEVNRVELVQGGDTSVVYERVDGTWQITAPVQTQPDTSNLTSNLETFLEAEKKRTITTELTDLQPYGLDKPQARIGIAYRDTGKATLLVGDETPTASGIFVKLEEKPAIYTAGNNIQTEGTKGLFDLRDRSIVHFDRNRISRIVLDRGEGRSLEFTKFGNDWRLEDPNVRVQNSAVNRILRDLSNNKFQDVVQETPENLTEYGIDEPSITVSLFSDDTTRDAVLKLGESAEDSDSPEYYARDLARPMIFTIRNDLVTQLQKSPFEFQNKQLFDVNRNQITDVEISWNDTTYTVSKVDTVWKMTAPVEQPVRESPVQSITRDLSSIRVDELASYERTSPALYGLDEPWLRVIMKVSGSEYDGFTVGDTTDLSMRYITTDSSPYVYKIEENKLEDFQISAGSLAQEKTIAEDTSEVSLEIE